MKIKKPLIVGYKGEIGSFILNGLLKVMPKALDIWCVDVNETEEEVKDRIGLSDVIFLCIPMKGTIEWLCKHKDILKDKIVIEQASLKEWIYNDERVKEIDLRAMHVLFKPSQTPNKDDRKVGLFRKQFDDSWGKDIVELLSCSEVVWYANEVEHDKEMAIQQALIHRNLIVMGNMLDKCNGSTFIVKRVKELRDRILSGNKDMYGSIQNNPYLSDNLKEFVQRMECFDINYYWE